MYVECLDINNWDSFCYFVMTFFKIFIEITFKIVQAYFYWVPVRSGNFIDNT